MGISATLFKIVMWVAFALATPFLAYAILFALLGRGFWWIAIPAAIGALFLLAGLAAFAYVWWWLKKVELAMRAWGALSAGPQAAEGDARPPGDARL